MTFKLIVAMDKLQGIGKNNTLPWSFSKDLKYFSKITKGEGKSENAVVMGRKTFESIGRHLPGRKNIVLSTQMKSTENITICSSVDDVLDYCNKNYFNDIWIIGGAEIYKEFLSRKGLIKSIYITKIDGDYKCDTFIELGCYLHNYKCESIELETQDNVILQFLVYNYYNYDRLTNSTIWEGVGEGKFL